MTVIAGINADVTFATGYDMKATAWTINLEAEDIDITALSERWRTHLAGVYGWGGTYTAWIDTASITGTITGTTAGGLAFGQTSAAATFQMTTGDTFTGSIIITGIDGNVATASGAGEFTFTFVGDGALTVNT